MRISFREINGGLANEIFVSDSFIGTVEKNVWNGKWVIKPDFNYYGYKMVVEKKKYDSFYKAGKALAKLYNDVFTFPSETEHEDTQEIDMRGIFTQRGP